jgi:hypothetical protein
MMFTMPSFEKKFSPQEWADNNSVFVSRMANGKWVESEVEPRAVENASVDWNYQSDETVTVREIQPWIEETEEIKKRHWQYCCFVPKGVKKSPLWKKDIDLA